jgi:hypothetical protein
MKVFSGIEDSLPWSTNFRRGVGKNPAGMREKMGIRGLGT